MWVPNPRANTGVLAVDEQSDAMAIYINHMADFAGFALHYFRVLSHTVHILTSRTTKVSHLVVLRVLFKVGVR